MPHIEIHPSLNSDVYRAIVSGRTHGKRYRLMPTDSEYNAEKLQSTSSEEQRFSINVHPRLEDINVAYRDLVLYRGWQRVALLYTGLRDAAGDGSGASAFHLQHLLLQNDIDCLTRRLPKDFHVSKK